MGKYVKESTPEDAEWHSPKSDIQDCAALSSPFMEPVIRQDHSQNDAREYKQSVEMEP
jgi:hypothetical protein